jgi:hypothetical protein
MVAAAGGTAQLLPMAGKLAKGDLAVIQNGSIDA